MDVDPKGKFYRAKKESFLWLEGAILVFNVELGSEGGYSPLNGLDVWDVNKSVDCEYISAQIIEDCPEWFERVYPVKKTGNDDVSFMNAQESKDKYKFEFDTVKIK